MGLGLKILRNFGYGALCILLFAGSASLAAGNSQSDCLVDLLRSAFQRPVAKKAGEITDEAFEAVVQKVRAYSAETRTREFVERQDRSILEHLLLHGHAPGTKSGREALTYLSHYNLARLKMKFPYQRGDIPAELESAIDRLELRYVHNTTKRRFDPESALLSSRVFQQAGAPVGLNTLEFNTKLLRSDDQVFFFPEIVLPGEIRELKGTAYGRQSVLLHPEYANKNVMISAFVMYPPELVEVARSQSPKLAEKMHSVVEDLSLSGYRLGADPDLDERLKTAMKGLHEYDFVTDDYLRFYKHVVKSEIRSTLERTPYLKEHYVDRLKSGSASALFDDQFETGIEHRLGSKFNFEARVPLAVPAGQFDIVSPPRK